MSRVALRIFSPTTTNPAAQLSSTTLRPLYLGIYLYIYMPAWRVPHPPPTFDHFDVLQSHLSEPLVYPSDKHNKQQPDDNFLAVSPKVLYRLPLVYSKANSVTTASAAVSFVSVQDFSLRQTFHVITSLPPPLAAEDAKEAR